MQKIPLTVVRTIAQLIVRLSEKRNISKKKYKKKIHAQLQYIQKRGPKEETFERNRNDRTSPIKFKTIKSNTIKKRRRQRCKGFCRNERNCTKQKQEYSSVKTYFILLNI